jgi:hypothetical protein
MRAPLRLLTLILALATQAAAADLVFQAPDPDTILVVHADPEVGDEPANGAELALLLRKGSVAKAWRAADLLEAGELRIDRGRVQWLAAAGSRVMREGVELRLSSGRRMVLRFDGAGPERQARPVPVAELSCPCSYTDDEGVYNLVGDASEVPQQYRVRALPVGTDRVQVLPMPPPPPPDERAEEPPRPQASAQRAPQKQREQRPPLDYYEYIRRITGQRGPQYRVNCIGNDGKPMPCTWLEPYITK